MEGFNNMTFDIWGVESGFINATPVPPAPFVFEGEEEYFMFLKTTIFFRVVICMLGIWTNALNTRTFYRIGLKDTVTIVLFGLAVSDLCHLCSALVYVSMNMVSIVEFEFHIQFEIPSGPLSGLLSMAIRMFVEITNMTTVFLALQRCLCVVFPLHFKGTFTKKRVIFVIFGIWLFSCSLTLLFLYPHQLIKVFDPVLNDTRYVMAYRRGRKTITNVYSTIFGLLFIITNQVTILICVFVMASALARSVRFRQMSSSTATTTTTITTKDSEQNEENDAKKETAAGNTRERMAIVQVTLVSTIFLVCNTPRLAGVIAMLVEPRFDLGQKYHNLFSLMYVAITAFETINSSLNFLVYYNYNTKFRSVCFDKKPKK